MSRLTRSERMLLAYLVLTTIVGAVRYPSQHAIAWVLLANAMMAAMLVAGAHATGNTPDRPLRAILPILMLMALYPALDILNGFGAVQVHDPQVRSLEHALFGADISRTWWQAMPSRFWSTVLHAAYLSYYPILLGPPVYFLLRGDVSSTERTVRWVLSVFLLSYICFLFFPVAGPYYEFPRPAAWFLDNPAARLVYRALDRGSAYGAAFPSSHVAGTLVALAAAYRGSRWLGHVILLPAVLLTIGVVYCQMHYAVDALAGIALAGVVVGFWRWWDHR
ncbi:MAG TPA: phosphatase PAP2 family protein [Gemmatimonadales bacterium]|nr:phosphatase PAP2 family protein [Gemmatimonadales bacterium]